MRLEAACRPVFARHETFHPRYGWVKKAHDAAAADAGMFNRDDAVVRLGVGKNMVRAIRFWGLAFKALTDVAQSGSRTHLTVPSTFGHVLFSENGWDPYCELPGTLWLLHWSLLAPPCAVPVWWLALNEFSAIEFTAEELEQFVLDCTRDWEAPHPSSIKKDVLCFLRMYAMGQAVRATFDDLVDCPFRELSLLRQSPTRSGAFRFLIGAKPALPPAIAAFACLDFVARTDSSANVVSVNRLVSEHGSPGRVFKLTEAELSRLLEQAAMVSPEIELTSAAGVPQIAFDDDPSGAATDVLRDHYQRLTGEAHFHGALRLAGQKADEPIDGSAPLDLIGAR
jgi:hypothetical protein